MKCISLNARSILNKMDELIRLVFEVEPYIIGFTETWIRPDMGDAEFTLPGYRMFRNDRKLRREGRVIINY